MNSIIKLDASDLVDNPTPRVPICMVLDTSGSMRGDPIRELNKGIDHFISEIRSDDIAKWSAELSIITFGPITVEQEFTNLQSLNSVSDFEAGGDTPMGKAVAKGLELLDRRKSEYSAAGIDYYQPWLVLMTDGHPTDGVIRIAKETSDLVNTRKLTIFPIGVGSGADLDSLRKFSPKREPIRLKGMRFKQFFEWLSRSVSIVSQSTPGNKVELDLSGISGWAEL